MTQQLQGLQNPYVPHQTLEPQQSMNLTQMQTRGSTTCDVETHFDRGCPELDGQKGEVWFAAMYRKPVFDRLPSQSTASDFFIGNLHNRLWARNTVVCSFCFCIRNELVHATSLTSGFRKCGISHCTTNQFWINFCLNRLPVLVHLLTTLVVLLVQCMRICQNLS